MAQPCICKRWSEILKGLEVVKFNDEHWIKISVFEDSKILPRSLCFSLLSLDPLTEQHLIRYVKLLYKKLIVIALFPRNFPFAKSFYLVYPIEISA